jgi:hypothetical protein
MIGGLLQLSGGTEAGVPTPLSQLPNIILQMLDFGQLVRIKFILYLSVTVTLYAKQSC